MKVLMNYNYSLLLILFMVSCTEPGNVNDENTPPKNNKDVLMVGDYEFVENITESYNVMFSWEGDFTVDEKEKLKSWLTEVKEATNRTLGQYRFPIYANIIRSNSNYRPVPFGFARRVDGQNQVHLYVNPTSSYDELMNDWNAQHEFSHLSLPYLGKKHKWFSEGFATFLSRQTMLDQGLFTQVEFDSMYYSKIRETKTSYNSSTKTFIEVSDSLLENNNYGDMYWGSTTFFFTIDKRLRKERNMRFVDIMKEYQLKHRDGDTAIKDVVHSFDKIIGETWCWELMAIYRNQPSYKVMENY